MCCLQVGSTDAALRTSIHGVVDSLSHTINAIVGEIRKYSREGIIGSVMRVCKNSDFKEKVETLLRQIDADLQTLQTGALTDSLTLLDTILAESRQLSIQVCAGLARHCMCITCVAVSALLCFLS